MRCGKKKRICADHSGQLLRVTTRTACLVRQVPAFETRWRPGISARIVRARKQCYQAYNAEIADAAVASQKFVAPWRPGRTTWIKPSFVWMGYRSGWGRKDANQGRVLALDLRVGAFDAMLEAADLSSRGRRDGQTVVVHCDPQRGLGGEAGRESYTHAISGVRSLQLAIKPPATAAFADGAIAAITDVTAVFNEVGDLLAAGDIDAARALLPAEGPYPLPAGSVICD